MDELVFCPGMFLPMEGFCRNHQRHLLKSPFLVLHLEKSLLLCQRKDFHLTLLFGSLPLPKLLLQSPQKGYSQDPSELKPPPNQESRSSPYPVVVSVVVVVVVVVVVLLVVVVVPAVFVVVVV